MTFTMRGERSAGGLTWLTLGMLDWYEARLNVTLFEKLRIDTGITLPELAVLPLDQAGADVPKVLNTVHQAIMNRARWEVKEELHLGLFSFTPRE